MNTSEFSRIVNMYRSSVYRVAYCRTGSHADADDITQNVFLKLYTRSAGLKSDMRDEEIKAWLLRAAINECNDLFRSYSRTHAVSLTGAEEETYPDPTRYDGESAVLSAIMKLKTDVRVAMYMHYYEEYSVKEIAKIMGKSETWVTTNLSRGRKKLKDILVKEGTVERRELNYEL